METLNDAGTPGGARENRTPPGRPVRRAGIVGAALVAAATLLAGYLDHRAALLDREDRERDARLWASACADPAAAAALVRAMPAAAAACRAGTRHLLAIPVEGTDPGPALLGAYLDRLPRLLTAGPPSTDVTTYLGAVHRDGRYADGLARLRLAARHCRPEVPDASAAPATHGTADSFFDDWRRIEITPDPATIRVSGGTGAPATAGTPATADAPVTIDSVVVDTAPACLTRSMRDATTPVRTGTTALSLTFTVGVDEAGRRVWLLEQATACPVRPDPIIALPLTGTFSLTRRQAVRRDAADSLFAFTGSQCG